MTRMTLRDSAITGTRAAFRNGSAISPAILSEKRIRALPAVLKPQRRRHSSRILTVTASLAATTSVACNMHATDSRCIRSFNYPTYTARRREREREGGRGEGGGGGRSGIAFLGSLSSAGARISDLRYAVPRLIQRCSLIATGESQAVNSFSIADVLITRYGMCLSCVGRAPSPRQRGARALVLFFLENDKGNSSQLVTANENHPLGDSITESRRSSCLFIAMLIA